MPINKEQAIKIFFQYFDPLKIEINNSKDFEWGIIFYWNSIEYGNTGKNALSGNSPVLIDKIDGSLHSMRDLGDFSSYDQKLENYRIKKGYPHVIKFPTTVELNKMSNIEKVLSLMRTCEVIQVEQAIEIIKEEELFNLDNFLDLFYPKYETKVETIANNIQNIEGNYILNNVDLKKIPSEINLFKNCITSLHILDCQVEILPNEITDLKNLQYILIELSPIKKMPFDLRKLTKLESVELILTNLKTNDVSKFLIPKNCEINIEGEYPYN